MTVGCYLFCNACLLRFSICICRISILPNGTLVFNSVRGRDGGPYKCSGVTLAGIQQSFTAELVLACKYQPLFVRFEYDK